MLSISMPDTAAAASPTSPSPVIYHFSDYSAFERAALQYWKVYFDLGYYTLLIPFRFQYNAVTEQYRLKTSRLQRILRLLLFTITAVFFVFNILHRYRLIKSTRVANRVNPTAFFDLISYVSDTVLMLPMYCALGRNRPVIEEIFHRIQPQARALELKGANYRSTVQLNNYTQEIRRKTSKKSKFIARGLSALTLIMVVLYFLDIFQDVSWNAGGVSAYFEADANKVFGILCGAGGGSARGAGNVTKPTAALPAKCAWSPALAKFFAVVVFIGNWADMMINTYGDLLFTVTAFLFHDLVQAFKLELLKDAAADGSSKQNKLNNYNKLRCKNVNFENAGPTSTNIDKILAHYERLKTETRKINSAMGLTTFTFVIGNLPFFVTNVFDVFDDTTSNFVRTITLFVCAYFFGSLFLAAKANSDVAELKQWLWRNENYAKMSAGKLSVLVQEINSPHSHPVALNAFGCLMINYTQFGSIVSIILTYAFLKFQFQGAA